MDIHDLEKIFGLSSDVMQDMMASTVGPDATEEEIETAVMEIMANIEKMVSQPYSLRDCLSFLAKEDLIEVMKTLKFSGYSKMRKNELVQYLENALSDPNFMARMYLSLNRNEVEILKHLCVINAPLVSTDIMFSAADLIRHGLCYIDEYGKHLVMPEELKQTFIMAQANETLQNEQERNSVIYDVCNAAVYFYGVYPINELCEHIHKIIHQPITETDLIKWQKGSAIHREEFFFKNGYIISTALQDTPEDVVALQQIQKMKKRTFWPDSETLSTLSMEQWIIDDNLYEPFWDFASILMENEFGDVMSVSRFVEASIRTGAPFDALMGFLSEQIFAFESIEQVDQFTQVMQNIWNSTPMWENCGYSPKQMRAVFEKPTAKSKVVSLAEHRAKKQKQ